MSSPARGRSASRTPAETPTAIAAAAAAADDGRRSRSRSRDFARSLSRGRTGSPNSLRDQSRTKSRDSRDYRGRSYSRSISRHRSPSIPRSAKIVIEKLTKNVNEAHLREIFSTYGDIQDLEMPMNRQFMMNKGIAYILFTEARYAEEAIAHMHEAQLDGAQINVSIVLPRRRFSRSPPSKRPPPNRFGEPHRFRDGAPPRGPPPERAYRPPPRTSPGFRSGGWRTPPRYGGRGGGYRDRHDDRDTYRPRGHSRSYSPVSRSPPPRRRRSPSYDSRPGSPGHNRSPPPRRRDLSPPRWGRRRRSPSYSSYGSRSRSWSRDRTGWRR